jgi:hypothetical protein
MNSFCLALFGGSLGRLSVHGSHEYYSGNHFRFGQRDRPIFFSAMFHDGAMFGS